MTSNLDLHYDLLPHSLRFLSISTTDLCSNTYSLLRSLYYSPPSQYADGRFFSYTETPSEISIVLDYESLIILQQSMDSNTNLILGDAAWRAICLQESSIESMQKFEVSVGLVTLISRELAERGISIFYLSTFQTDYLLCKDEELEVTIRLLESLVSQSSIPKATTLKSPVVDLSTVRLNLKTVPTPLTILSVSSSDLVSLTRALISATFYPPSRSDRFFSFSDIEGIISLIVDIPTLALIEEFDPRFANCERWRAIQVDGNFGFTEVGLVYSLSAPLTAARICPFYLSLFHTDFVLVQEKNYSEALELLKEKFNIQPENTQTAETEAGTETETITEIEEKS